MTHDPRAREVAALVDAGMSPEAAENYYDSHHGWEQVRVRPIVLRHARAMAERHGITIHEVILAAVEAAYRQNTPPRP